MSLEKSRKNKEDAQIAPFSCNKSIFTIEKKVAKTHVEKLPLNREIWRKKSQLAHFGGMSLSWFWSN